MVEFNSSFHHVTSFILCSNTQAAMDAINLNDHSRGWDMIIAAMMKPLRGLLGKKTENRPSLVDSSCHH